MSAEGVAGAGRETVGGGRFRSLKLLETLHQRATLALQPNVRRDEAGRLVDERGWSMPAIATRGVLGARAGGSGATKTLVEPLFEIRDAASGPSRERATRDASMRRLSSSMDSTLAASLPFGRR